MSEYSLRSEAAIATTPELVELDGRESNGVFYRLVCNLGARALALIAIEGRGRYKIERTVCIPPDEGNEAMAHPESKAYLGGDEVIYDGGYEKLIVAYREPPMIS